MFRPANYADKLGCLADLQTLAVEGHIDLFYGDESGFSLLPVVPYSWQAAGLVSERPSRYSPRLNVLAWLNEAGHLVSFTTEQSVNSKFVIDCINQWARGLVKPTVLVLDNAPIHPVRRCGSKAFAACITKWQSQGLYVFFLPAYSPHLNKIETLWPVRRCGKIKYEWLETTAYATYESLKAAVKHILVNFGQAFCIRFARRHCTINFV